jgi:hypothetical protein
MRVLMTASYISPTFVPTRSETEEAIVARTPPNPWFLVLSPHFVSILLLKGDSSNHITLDFEI